MKSSVNPIFFIPVAIFLVLLFFVPTQYHWILKIALLISLLPLVYLELKKLRKEDKQNGTNVFYQRLAYMGIILGALSLFYFFTQVARV